MQTGLIRAQPRGFWIIVCAFALFWILLSTFGSPRGAGHDVLVYKAPGCNLADGLGFTAEGMPGNVDFNYHLFASGGPGVPFLFGLVASVFGCTGRVNTFFELACATADVVGVAYFVAPLLRGRLRWIAAVLVGLALPSGLIFSEFDRPGVPAFAIFLFACLMAGSARPVLRLVVAPLAAGICALFFPFGGALAGLAIWVITATARPVRLAAAALLALRLAVVFLIPVVLVVALYAWLDPTSGGRFLGNAVGDQSGIGSVMHRSYSALLLAGAFSAGAYSLSLVASFLVVTAVVLGFALRRTSRQVSDLVLLFGLVALPILTLLFFPKQNDYMAWTRTALLVLLAVSPAPLALRAQRVLVPALLVLICLTNIPFVWIEALKEIQSGAEYQVAMVEDAAFALEVRKQPPGLVGVPSGVFFLYRPVLPMLVDLGYVRVAARSSDVVAVASCYYGSKDGRPVDEDISPANTFLPPMTLLSQASSRYVPTLLGRRLTHSEWGWSCDHYLAQRAHPTHPDWR